MASEKLGMVPPQHIHNGLSLHPHPQLVYPGFAFGPQAPHRCSAASSLAASSTTATSFSTTINRLRRRPPSSITSGPKAAVRPPPAVAKHQKTMMLKMRMIMKRRITEGNSVQVGNGSSNDNNSSSEARNLGEEVYYAQNLHGAVDLTSTSGQKDIMEVENGCGNGRKKESCYSGESQESLRSILSDPLPGALMDDAMILPCGHSFGSGGMQQISRMVCGKDIGQRRERETAVSLVADASSSNLLPIKKMMMPNWLWNCI